jgi:hypothetical protein
MEKPASKANWKRSMLHAWLSLLLLMAFYMLSFGSRPAEQQEQQIPTTERTSLIVSPEDL